MSTPPTEAETVERNKCEQNIYGCIQNNPTVKLMMVAMNKSGWYVDSRIQIVSMPRVTLYLSIRLVHSTFVDTSRARCAIIQWTAASIPKWTKLLCARTIRMLTVCQRFSHMKWFTCSIIAATTWTSRISIIWRAPKFEPPIWRIAHLRAPWWMANRRWWEFDKDIRYEWNEKKFAQILYCSISNFI